MQIRAKIDDATPKLELNTTNNRITIANPIAGEIQLYISATDTSTINWVSGVYDLELVSPSGDVTRLVEGTVSISREVTR